MAGFTLMPEQYTRPCVMQVIAAQPNNNSKPSTGQYPINNTFLYGCLRTKEVVPICLDLNFVCAHASISAKELIDNLCRMYTECQRRRNSKKQFLKTIRQQVPRKGLTFIVRFSSEA